jgi:hypothetical protein
MDSPEGIQVKERGPGRFLEKFTHPPSSESPLKYKSAFLFLNDNYATNLDVCGENLLRT